MFITSHLKRESKGRLDSVTPPMPSRSRSRSRSSSCSSFDESYFSKTYIPLSSLPTPPPSSHSNASSRQQSPDTFSSQGQVLDPELLGPAIHLTNLIPSSTSLITPSVTLVHAILTRADLPLETLALAVCILDSLNSRFALQWRKGCPRTCNTVSEAFSPIESRTSQQHIDSIHPELIVLSALTLAVKFLDDEQQRTIEYAIEWGKDIWTCPQINFTQRSLLENLGYRLLPLWEESIILEALEDMDRAGQQYTPVMCRASVDWDDADPYFGRIDLGLGAALRKGNAMLGLGHRITPVETSRMENVRGMKDVDGQTRNAFWLASEPVLHLHDRMAVRYEPFPLYVEPGFGI